VSNTVVILNPAARSEKGKRWRARVESVARGSVICATSRAGEAETSLFITPGYRFRIVDRLLTNFHLPQSTLLMLVCAFGGYDAVRAAYAHAIDERYRFFSYGDAMLLERDPSAGTGK